MPVPGVPQGGVAAALVKEFVVGALFGDVTVFDDDDPVGVVGGVESVGNGNDGAAREGCVEVLFGVLGVGGAQE